MSCEQTLQLPSTVPNGQVEDPVFVPEGGNYIFSQEIVISCPTDSAQIYYTTDGTTPDLTSTLYTAPISIGETDSPVTITAIGFLTSMTASTSAAHSYIIDSTAPVISENIFGWETSEGYAVSWVDPITADSVVFSITANGETVMNSYDPEDEEGLILSSDFTTPPTSSSDITEITLTFYDAAGNSTISDLALGVDSVSINPVDGYYLTAKSVTLSSASADYIYYTVDGSNPDWDSREYTDSHYLDGNTVTNQVQAIAYKNESMAFLDDVSEADIRIDTSWDNSFEMTIDSSQIALAWNEPFSALSGNHFDNITIDITSSTDGGVTVQEVFLPVDQNELIFDNAAYPTKFASGEAFSIAITATDEDGDTIDGGDYDDIYIRDGFLMAVPDDLDLQEWSLSINGTGNPWAYEPASLGTQEFLISEGQTITRMLRNSDGTMLYYILTDSGVDQIYAYDFLAVPTLLTSSSGDIIDFTMADSDTIVFVTTDNISTYTISTDTTVVDFTFSSITPLDIEFFDSTDLILLYGTGEIDTVTYVTGGSTSITPVQLGTITGVTALLKSDSKVFIDQPNSDGESTDIYELENLTPTLSTTAENIEHTGLNFHDISSGGANILISADDYSYYSGERLFVYSMENNTMIEVMALSSGISDCSW